MWNFLKKLFKSILGAITFGVGVLILPVSYLYDKITGNNKNPEQTKEQSQNGSTVNFNNINSVNVPPNSRISSQQENPENKNIKLVEEKPNLLQK